MQIYYIYFLLLSSLFFDVAVTGINYKTTDDTQYFIPSNQIKFIEMIQEEKMFKRGSKPKDIQLNSNKVDEIKNSMLTYPIESQYYVYLRDRNMLNAILFLCFLKEKKIMSKKIKSVLQNKQFKQGWYSEMKDVYFSKDFEKLNVVQLVQKASQSFNNHEPMIKGIFKTFQQLSPNSIFQNDLYKNKLRVREIIQHNLVQFNNLSFKDQGKDKKNDLVLMKQEDGNGIFLLCFSSEKVKPQNDSIFDEQIMRNSRKKELSQKPKTDSSAKNNQMKQKKQDLEQTFDEKELQKVYNFEQEDEKKDERNFSIVLAIILFVIMFHIFSDVLSNPQK